MRDFILEIYQSLNRNKTRTALTGVAVMWGVFMLVVLLGMSQGMLNAFDDGMDATSAKINKVQIWGGITKYPYRGYEAGRRIRLRDDDIEPLAHENTHHVSTVIARINGNDSARVNARGINSTASVYGVFPQLFEIYRYNIKAGRPINKRDIDQRRKCMVISVRTSLLLFGDSTAALGQTVNYCNMAWRVVGVYDKSWTRDSFVPYSTLKHMAGNNPYVDDLTVLTRDMESDDDVQQVNSGIISTLARLHQFDEREGDSGGIWMWNSFESYLRNREANRMLITAVWIIGVLTLLTGIVGISNIMFVSVRERTHEIGIRRAIGAKPRSIMANVVWESVAITAIFGYIGIFLGTVAVVVADHIIAQPNAILNPGITLTMAVELTLLLVMAGAMAGLAPAVKATRISPVEALRDE